jgi:uncharacterized protein YbjT (DUF2867 family)
MAQTAIIAGGTGLVGGFLLERLLNDQIYSSVIAVTRRTLNRRHEKLTEVICDFTSLDDHRDDLKGDVVFCCLGTTQRVAGSREKFCQVDHDYPVKIGEIALQNGAKAFVLVSALGASVKSPSYYMRVKGETERDLGALGYEALHIVRPSLILGQRSESRVAEDWAQKILPYLSFAMVGRLKKYRPIKADQIAKAMLTISKAGDHGMHVHASDALAAY